MRRRLLVALAMIPITIGTINPAPAGAAVVKACPQWRATALEAGMSSAEFAWLSPKLYRESRCQPHQTNPKQFWRAKAFGLAQIYWPAWGRELTYFGISKADLLDPSINMWAATYVMHRQGKRAWSL